MNRKETMLAALVSRVNGPLEVVEIPRPVAREGQVLVKVAASALNPLDAKIRSGQAPHAKQPLPAVLGIDLAGTVVALGPGVVNVQVGDAVIGMVGGVGGLQGTLAQYVAVDARLLAPQPRLWSPREAATLPLAFVTAWEGLVDRGRVGEGQKVLVQAGAGGVGHAAVQLAVARGATVFATGRETHREVIEAAGAQFLNIEDDVNRLAGAVDGGFDLVYDTLGGAFLDQGFQLVRPFGHVVSCLGWGHHALAPLSFKGATYSGVFTLEPLLSGRNPGHLGAILTEATRLADAGALHNRVAPEPFTLDSVNEAFVLLGSHAGSGRVVVEIH